jgi:yecA family protein
MRLLQFRQAKRQCFNNLIQYSKKGCLFMPKEMPEYDAVQDQLAALLIPITAAELHGALSGCICAGAELTPKNWLAFALTDAEMDGKSEPGSALWQLFDSVSAQFAGDVMEFAFDIFLPDEGKQVSERGPAMVEWCQGFLGGFGVVPMPTQSLSDETEEILQDIAKIAASDLNYDDTESDEDALIEVCEYLRVATLLLYNERVVNRQHRQRLN